ncbi:unnamed protein product [Brachionus calyciflorus]|uniref:Uncharacterized protein n=1 Tax=Brachionus calyciflorus TaxID=104777 RepID=A0A813QJK5_9BILA|nr:unnamed protein product [Brachionus calyciflorus]
MKVQIPENSTDDEFLKLAVEISNRYLQNEVVQSGIKKKFSINEKTFENIKKINLVYSEQLKLNSKEPDNLGWTDRILDTNTIHVNNIFRKRFDHINTKSYKDTTRHKKEREIKIIVVYISILLLHELGHLLVRWSGKIDSPEAIGEAGTCIELIIFNGNVRLLLDSKSKWDENKQHIGIGIERENEFRILSYQDYIQKVYDGSMSINLYNEAIFVKRKMDSHSIAKKVSDEDQEHHELKNAVPIESCGVRRCAFIKISQIE